MVAQAQAQAQVQAQALVRPPPPPPPPPLPPPRARPPRLRGSTSLTARARGRRLSVPGVNTTLLAWLQPALQRAALSATCFSRSCNAWCSCVRNPWRVAKRCCPLPPPWLPSRCRSPRMTCRCCRLPDLPTCWRSGRLGRPGPCLWATANTSPRRAQAAAPVVATQRLTRRPASGLCRPTRPHASKPLESSAALTPPTAGKPVWCRVQRASPPCAALWIRCRHCGRK